MEDDQFQFLMERQVAEQGFYWQRFTAFAAINSGFLVLLAGTESHIFLKFAGLVASVLWLFVQWKSRNYVEAQKNEFWDQAEDRGYKRQASDGTISVTHAGVITSGLSVLFWISTFIWL